MCCLMRHKTNTSSIDPNCYPFNASLNTKPFLIIWLLLYVSASGLNENPVFLGST